MQTVSQLPVQAFKRMRILAILPAALAALPAAALAADDCAGKARLWQEINVGSGIYTERAVASTPLMLRVPVGVDGELAAECLRLEGFDPAAAMRAEFERAEGCRTEARRLRLAPEADGAGSRRIGSEVDEAAWRACLQQDVEVQVLPAE